MNKLIGIYNRPTPLRLLLDLRREGVSTSEVTFKVLKFKGGYLYSAILN